jgi:hypothetical protein
MRMYLGSARRSSGKSGYSAEGRPEADAQEVPILLTNKESEIGQFASEFAHSTRTLMIVFKLLMYLIQRVACENTYLKNVSSLLR